MLVVGPPYLAPRMGSFLARAVSREGREDEMIRTESEYLRAQKDLLRDAAVIDEQRRHFERLGLSGAELQRVMEPMESFHAQLQEEVEVYERIRRGELGDLHDLNSIGRWLIGIRIALGLSQRDLAERLGVSEAQVSRDERNEYHGIGVDRAQRILEAFGVHFRMELEEPLLDQERELVSV